MECIHQIRVCNLLYRISIRKASRFDIANIGGKGDIQHGR
jgi:hypothetical protein